MKSIAVLLTCHNRKETTLNCLSSLFQCTIPLNYLINVYLTDDGSTDGTYDALIDSFPNLNIIKGNGNLYWGGGMRLAWNEASKVFNDAYIWLNDDTLLTKEAILTLIETEESNKQSDFFTEGIIVGSCFDPSTGKQTYGGRLRKYEDKFVYSKDKALNCDLINGNIVYVPNAVFEKIGNISCEFVHLGGDNDYGLRAIKAGFKVWVAPGFIGVCESHPYLKWADPKVSLKDRWKYMHSPKGQPLYEVYIYARRHSGFFWINDILKLYFRLFFPELHSRLKSIKSFGG